jgi:peptidoglycan DL-endopeptidase CwlO
MSPTQSRLESSAQLADSGVKRPIGRRRHARHTEANWVKRAGVATGVIGAAVLTAGAAPPTHGAQLDTTPLNEISQTLDVSQLRATEAIAQTAVDYQLTASQSAAAATALRQAQDRKEAERKKAAAEAAAKAKAAKARQEAAARESAHIQLTAAGTSVTASASVPTAGNISTVLAFVRAQLGKAYVLGATGPNAYDCSGLVQAAFRTIGVDLPRVSQAQSATGTQVSLSALRPGDILYWGAAGSAYHVAIYVGGGDFIGAQNPSSGVVEHPLSYDEPTGAVRVA